jgi:glycosyltransferase involved in cell wall biosynthesis
LLYTNENEYFDTLLIEAMYLKCLVLGCNSGSTLEVIAHEYTGFLLPSSPRVWGEQIKEIVEAKD